MPLAAADRESLIGACPLFTGLDETGLAAVSAAAVEVDFPAERIIAREGEIGTGLFIVGKGGVRVMRDGQAIARLGPGEFFGELSVLDGRPRNAMVAAETATTCLAIASWDFEAVLLANPTLTLAILRGVASRLREPTEAVRH